jgi:hypothetical protein
MDDKFFHNVSFLFQAFMLQIQDDQAHLQTVNNSVDYVSHLQSLPSHCFMVKETVQAKCRSPSLEYIFLVSLAATPLSCQLYPPHGH